MSGLGGLRLVANAADNVIAIGSSGHDPVGRYKKHLFSRSTPIVFNALHVPLFRIGKIGSNFLGFDFGGFGSERELLIDRHEQAETPLIEWIWEQAYKGRTVRQIALDCGRSKTTVHRLMQIRPIPRQIEKEQEEEDLLTARRKNNPYYFPGSEEYDEAGENPRFDDIYGYEHDHDREKCLLRAEAFLIETATHRANMIYKKTGKAPPLSEDPELIEFYATNKAASNIDSS